jgi:streptomycin 6-kinase
MAMIPDRLVAACRATAERTMWLDRLPQAIRDVQDRWSLSLGSPFDAGCAWVAPAVRGDGVLAVLKLGMPQMEGADESKALRFWDGDAAVRLLECDAGLNAMLLERCEPGSAIQELPEPEQDVVVAGLLRRLWRKPETPHAFRPLSTMTAYWADETMAAAGRWPADGGLIQEGLHLFEELARPSSDDVVLATDLHASNILRAQREPWLAIDPKPFVGDRAYDATQHLLNCKARLRVDPDTTIRRFADLLDVDDRRVRLWTFARLASEPRDLWDDDAFALARSLA